jgi:uncharacterized protein YyaL (SSP411 family)
MNRLQFETSPYLLQHAHNPVDWYAWKPEAFERARAEQKPILVSIGYSTCHWCHVMERESFEDEAVAAFMNEHYINIKVDREERPDVDAVYMEACQILTGSGGWPLNCFLTPEGKPFYAGTYYPPRPAYNRPSWMQLLQHLANIWDQQRDTALNQAERLLNNIQRNDGVFINLAGDGQQIAPEPELLFQRLRTQFDQAEGGFGGAPKFPASMAIHWLLNWHYFSGNPEALEHALFSLEKMVRGGIYDQIGGGFARYATDRAWLVPHFEKMLYDNALLVNVLSEAHKYTVRHQPGTPGSQWADIIEQTLDYIAREMTHPEGGFYAAQDADSEGVEGKYYVWDKSELEELLGKDATLFCDFYGVTEKGNWEERNILWRPHRYQDYAASRNIPLEMLQNTLHTCGEMLLRERSKRVPPGLDHKILLDWNALMVSAYAAAYAALGHDSYLQAAVKNLGYLNSHFKNTDGTWRHSASQPQAFLDDYAFLIAAWVDVHQITFQGQYLEWAEEAVEYVLEHFQDPESGLLFNTDSTQTDIIYRKKNVYDNATPSGNSTMVHNLQRLGILLDRPDWREKARQMMGSMRETVEKYPRSFECWALAMLNESFPMLEIAIIGENSKEKAREIQRAFLPNKVVAVSDAPADDQPLLRGKPGAADALIYLCRDYACQKPVTTLEDFWNLVDSQ